MGGKKGSSGSFPRMDVHAYGRPALSVSCSGRPGRPGGARRIVGGDDVVKRGLAAHRRDRAVGAGPREPGRCRRGQGSLPRPPRRGASGRAPASGPRAVVAVHGVGRRVAGEEIDLEAGLVAQDTGLADHLDGRLPGQRHEVPVAGDVAGTTCIGRDGSGKAFELLLGPAAAWASRPRGSVRPSWCRRACPSRTGPARDPSRPRSPAAPRSRRRRHRRRRGSP
jgi:hypothetical protein